MTDLGDASIHPCEIVGPFEQVGLVAAVSTGRIHWVLASEAVCQITTFIAYPD
jgi:hypothetical protein